MLERCKAEPFMPIRWMKDHPGMQGDTYLNEEDSTFSSAIWHQAKERAIEAAIDLSNAGVTKQFCNRLLEPFMWHTVIATATDWENFFSLRAHEAAEIHIQDLAYKMLEAYNAGTPKQLQPGEWHIPFGDQIEVARIPGFNDTHYVGWLEEQKRKIATARCARISYNTFEGKDDYEADIKLHDRLAASGHMSPMEHCARAMSETERIQEYGYSGNFRGFIQYRKLFNNENRKDGRVRETPNQSTTDSEHQQTVGAV